MNDEKMNPNQSLIDGLRKAADFLESRPNFPYVGKQYIGLWCWNDEELLRRAARELGSFTKEFTSNYFELHKPMSKEFNIQVMIDREQVCKKIVTWDCPDDESLLKLVEPETVEAE